MRRRKLLSSSAIAVGAALGGSVISSCQIRQANEEKTGAQTKVSWRMATSWPPSLNTIFGGAETICQRVNSLSNGLFEIKPYAGGEIVPGLEVLDAVQAGSVECGHTASYYYKGKNPSFVFGTSVPFGLTAQQQNAWLYEGGGNEALNRIYADFGVISFPAGNTGAQMGGWFKEKLEGLNSLKGLKMRIPGIGGDVMAQLGVNVQQIAAGEIFLALERGAIDAAEWTGPYDDEKLGLHKAARYCYYPGWWEPGPTLMSIVNKQAWEKLPSDYKEIFKTACYQANLTMLNKYENLNSSALERLRKNGTEFVLYSNEILSEARRAAFQIYSDYSEKDIEFRKLFKEWNEFRSNISKWNKVNQFSLSSFNYLDN
tara:strand:- start:514 stop:1626 length:1113 start_codon:yes stop_codon:yes gene_type:complete